MIKLFIKGIKEMKIQNIRMGTNSIEYTRQYYKNNKERIHEIMGQKITCDHCGSTVRRSHMSRHHQTMKCKNYKNEKDIKF